MATFLRIGAEKLPRVKDKMNDWIANGAQLGWFIDPNKRQVLTYRAHHATEVVTGKKMPVKAPRKAWLWI